MLGLRLGEYLALTGDKLNGVEMIACGLATHYALNARLPMLEERLGKLVTDDGSVIEKALAQYGDIVYPDKRSIIRKIDAIHKCFCHGTVEEIIHALESEAAESYDEYKTTLKKLREASPLSLKVTLRSIREGRYATPDQCLAREYRISLGTVSQQVSKDFSEGVRARLMDKDFAPKWDPPSLGKVAGEMVDFYFCTLEESESELELPPALREPSI
ncbi:3-hydroxyisobutyryl-CoA hydrolase-like protein 2, mitochondrial [Punica granatum]|uniref:3-hydroxyisobutyryl-CoA hydrolase n=1 Tax=Punica granatum TaxID=22663 RepID=A0A6P8BR40_PUNGR|nr:3-hydroxyisobutyryl-CoA hydrolase-like protein 2, mitochondrial [Punica granatum]XP_031372281.1 3-hydroxyisobutyryl-CoA hydrolase-like protein 2, mitochondrial [Punica granatum]XP_031372282.1 3-hydroxyisobutyryl-CoA hydrolase-like protein 2, mitochondrial [Punica granatum]XP_031372283.1 3-hydroxyisobutyryl-CoA hydrolase-like protein 2, mitochondrial [Punica granatum]XP_031372285.1 3-hydroxyisobutyryl-CoA hydrolase-like protein 2, mitochondrial [Punica granatum]